MAKDHFDHMTDTGSLNFVVALLCVAGIGAGIIGFIALIALFVASKL